MFAQIWFRSHFNRNMHFPINVSYNVYNESQWKWLKLAFLNKMVELAETDHAYIQ